MRRLYLYSLVLAGVTALCAQPATTFAESPTASAPNEQAAEPGPGPCFGRHRPGQWPSPADHSMRMQQKLGLTDEQASKVSEINRQFAESMRGLHEKVREEHREEFTAIVQQRNESMKGVLNEEQYKQFMERQERMRKHRRGPGPMNGTQND
jgi:Spy/CpxP family protein refolding chaperone